MNFETLIDPTDFRTVAAYLRNPNSPIRSILHVKERAMLAPLAEQVTRSWEEPDGMKEFIVHLDRLFREGSLKITCDPGLGRHPREVVSVLAIPPSAKCEVIFMPPFYLAHTPGLFEGTLVRQAVSEQPQQLPQKIRPARMKI